MAKLLLGVAFEIAAALSVTGVLLAAVIPLMVRADMIQPGDATGGVVVIGTPIVALVIALLRPGSAIHRYAARNK